ncbi:XdhC family protein [Colwellia psychrerythraea]|uniref:Xanthine dehydrogenase n=1 Tax=Colwellia psychrerythraea TaxID=28229 RepID=A0A099L4K9_COLPS|nr:XdhC/CoxI family protein [Colwellia psychrerythraea]KGJ97380.1 Xanthine dehydrogenase [Colwellia psychrerythraea]
MSNRLKALLATWLPEKDSCQWVLASIIETQRSSYRKTGAIMLINSQGKSYGLLSGGCLEADLKRQAQKCWYNNTDITICYDMQDDNDIAWQLGIGCGGLVKVLLQPINSENDYLDLLTLKSQLDNRNACFYHIDTVNARSTPQSPVQIKNQVLSKPNNSLDLVIAIKPAPALVIFGGGLDAQPLVKIANTLGWYICLVDSRTAYARAAYFKEADTVINEGYASLEQNLLLPKADAIVVMHHNVSLDAHALKLVKSQANLACASYLGLLGPQHRTELVLDKAQLSSTDFPNKLSNKLANPIGLDLGGDLPESIALAILSQAHAAIEQASGKSLGFFHSELNSSNNTDNINSIKKIVNHAN